MSFIFNHRAIEKTSVRYIGSGVVSAGTGGGINPTYPTGILAGDLLVLHLFSRSFSQTITGGVVGWTLIANDTDTGNFMRQYTYYKIADGTETGSSGVISWSGGSSGVAGRISCFRGNALTSPIEGSIKTDANSNTVAHGSIAGTKRGMVVSCVGLSDDVVMATYSGAVNAIWVEGYQTLHAIGLQFAIQMQYGVIGSTGNITGGTYALAGGVSKVYINRSFAIKPL
jgi:hypothetical protein